MPKLTLYIHSLIPLTIHRILSSFPRNSNKTPNFFPKTTPKTFKNRTKMKTGQAESSKNIEKKGLMSRRIAIFEFLLRIVAFFSTISSAILMGTTNETLPFFTQFIRFRAEYNDLPALTFFVVANSVVSGYLILSLALAFVHIVKSKTQNSRIFLILLDVVMLGLLTAGASSAAAIVYLAHNGNRKTNWFAICQQFNSFCERISGSLIGSFIGVAILTFLIILSAIALSRRH